MTTKTKTISMQQRQQTRYSNALRGLAIGDAWGYQVEFKRYVDMPSYPIAPPPNTWVISDDTQMTLALANALEEIHDFDDLFEVTATITDAFLDWRVDPDNYRAPGATCMTSLRNIAAGAEWYDHDGALVKAGCGAVMRLLPAAFASDKHWAGLAALQALITHKHPGAVVSALIVADATRHAAAEGDTFIARALIAADDLKRGNHPWLTDPYFAGVLSPITTEVHQYLVAGLEDRLEDALHRAADQLAAYRAQTDQSHFGDPCVTVGAGWDAATATALALLTADMVATEMLSPRDAVAWAATTDGDSDSIAAIGGSIIGASSDAPGFWAGNGLKPKFEVRYGRELGGAVLPQHRPFEPPQ